MQYLKTYINWHYILVTIGAIYTFLYLDALWFHLLPFHKSISDFFFIYLDKELGIDEMLAVINLILTCLVLYHLVFIPNIFIKIFLFIPFLIFFSLHLVITCMIIFVWLGTF